MKNAIVDACVVAGMSVLYVVLEVLAVAKRWSFGVVGLVLVLYVIYLVRRRTPSWRDLGFRTDNIRAGLLPVGAVTLVGAIALVAWGLARGRAPSISDILLLLALYPVWAVVQQLAFQGLLHRSLMVLCPSPLLRVLVASTAFAAVHAGNALLVALTFAAGVAWSCLYRRHPNLLLLAASHTVLAALAYPLVVGDAPLSRF